MASSGRLMANTSGPGVGVGAASPEPAMRGGTIAGAGLALRGATVAGAARVVASGLATAVGLVRATRFALGTTGSGDRTGGGNGDATSSRASAPATDRLLGACRSGSRAAAPSDSATATSAGTSTARRSGASIRRSRQGRPKPGSPVPSPKIRPNSSVCSSRESNSASVIRLRSAIVRRRCQGPKRKARAERAAFGLVGGVRAVPGPIEGKSAPPSLLEHCSWCRAE